VLLGNVHSLSQWAVFRILRLLQQGLQQSLTNGGRDDMLAQPQDARSSDSQFAATSLSALTGPLTSIWVIILGEARRLLR
jgi:hypothetical protein